MILTVRLLVTTQSGVTPTGGAATPGSPPGCTVGSSPAYSTSTISMATTRTTEGTPISVCIGTLAVALHIVKNRSLGWPRERRLMASPLILVIILLLNQISKDIPKLGCGQ